MMKTKTLCFPGARNSFGNKSVRVAMKLSTMTNWVKKKYLVPFPDGRRQLFLILYGDYYYYVCVDSQKNQHQKEANTPELWKWQ